MPDTAMPRHIGIDLDNTIIDYQHVFAPVAAELGLLPPDTAKGCKAEIKARLIAVDSSETLWMRLQGQVYGRHIGKARPYEGVADCLAQLRAEGARVSIVSHKTRHGHFDPDRVDLWAAARGWLETNGFLGAGGLGIQPSDVHFELTREAKVERIRAIGCSQFIDDLPDVLQHPAFPAGVEPLWFAVVKPRSEREGLAAYGSWHEVMDSLLRNRKAR